ncbi:hypothetical protein F511_14877 [Dorcoceras hygrometricum]|uniref:Uncharacterized protein n=1 Tax=Dorcoceras hygrometricum TaxID=472368 RepID=A0A2Z7BS91_9LAMI|nr:hypothetical protein F511_14877 [Dorcoceras hygrometricum]
MNEAQNCSSEDQVQHTRAVIECEAKYKHSDRVKIRSQAGKGTPELEQHCIYQVVEDFKLDHQLGKAEEQFKHRIKQSSSSVNEAQNCSSEDQVQRTRAVIECEARYKRSDRVQIQSQAGDQIRNQLVKDKPAGQADQELIQEGGTLFSKVMNNIKWGRTCVRELCHNSLWLSHSLENTPSTTRDGIPSSACTRRPDEICVDGFSSSNLAGTISGEEAAAAAASGARRRRREDLRRRGGGGSYA